MALGPRIARCSATDGSRGSRGIAIFRYGLERSRVFEQLGSAKKCEFLVPAIPNCRTRCLRLAPTHGIEGAFGLPRRCFFSALKCLISQSLSERLLVRLCHLAKWLRHFLHSRRSTLGDLTHLTAVIRSVGYPGRSPSLGTVFSCFYSIDSCPPCSQGSPCLARSSVAETSVIQRRPPSKEPKIPRITCRPI
jgi:hypothetical protein